MPFDYVLNELSYENMILYGATIPSFDSDTKKGKDEEVIDSRDPKNKERLEQMFDNMI